MINYTVIPSGSLLGVQPAPLSWIGGEAGYDWTGVFIPVASAGSPVTTAFAVSVLPNGNIGYTISGPTPVVVQFGFVASSNPSNTQPSTWYQASTSVIAGKLTGLLQLGASGFAPALGTSWWVWLKLYTTLIQAGELFVV